MRLYVNFKVIKKSKIYIYIYKENKCIGLFLLKVHKDTFSSFFLPKIYNGKKIKRLIMQTKGVFWMVSLIILHRVFLFSFLFYAFVAENKSIIPLFLVIRCFLVTLVFLETSYYISHQLHKHVRA